MKPAFFADEDFQDHLVNLLCRDVGVLRRTASLLKPDDFKPTKGMRWGRPRWIIAELALNHYKRYHEAIGKLIRSELLNYVDSIGLGERQRDEGLRYIERLKQLKRIGPEAVTDKVVLYKKDRLRAEVLEELSELQAAGKLSDEDWAKAYRRVTGTTISEVQVSDYLGTIEQRVERRLTYKAGVAPLFLIDPLDSLVRGIGPKGLGLVLAPPGRGKSLFLAHIAMAFTLQRYNTMLVTLEDPKSELEDRMDAAITGIPIARLHAKPKATRKRFRRFRRLVRANLKLVDGTEEGFTVGQLEQLMLQERELGFQTDALIIDYDDEIIPERRYKDRRMETSDIYRALRQLAGRHHILVWTAAQTQRNTEHMKILSGDKVADDIGKIRKSTMTISMGQGDWGDDSIYLWVAKHKFDRMHVGCHIVPDRNCMMLYDRDRTRKAQAEYADQEGQEVA